MLAYFSMGAFSVSDDAALDEFTQLLNADTVTNKPCSLSRTMASLRPDVRDVMDRLLASNRSTRDIHLALQRVGFRVSRDTIGDHRVGRCTCGGMA
jgi:hypothetical protein